VPFFDKTFHSASILGMFYYRPAGWLGSILGFSLVFVRIQKTNKKKATAVLEARATTRQAALQINEPGRGIRHRLSGR
jgi:hypothetical protein